MSHCFKRGQKKVMSHGYRRIVQIKVMSHSYHCRRGQKKGRITALEEGKKETSHSFRRGQIKVMSYSYRRGSNTVEVMSHDYRRGQIKVMSHGYRRGPVKVMSHSATLNYKPVRTCFNYLFLWYDIHVFINSKMFFCFDGYFLKAGWFLIQLKSFGSATLKYLTPTRI